jgi:crotonobetainyl-CoA:carnitine CoA-transferase CaiB-like acyl-CoA transferase
MGAVRAALRDYTRLDALATNPLQSAHLLRNERDPAARGRVLQQHQAIRCADGYITLGAANDRLFQRLCDALGHPEWASDPDYANDTLRVRHRGALIARIETITAREPCDQWLARLGAAGVPCGPIRDYAEAFPDPQVRARGMVVDITHPTLGPLRTLRSPIKMSETPLLVDRRAPLLGEHTWQVLREVGYTDEEIEAVVAECAAPRAPV